MISGPWNPGFQDYRSALELASFDWYQHVGYKSHSVYVKNLIFNTEFQYFIISGKFQKFSGTLDIAWKAIFCYCWCICHHFKLILSLNMNFASKIEKCHVFNVFRCHLFQNPKITRDIKKYEYLPFLR